MKKWLKGASMKRIIVFALALLISCTELYAAPIYSYEETIPISESISLTRVESFYSDRNISYSYIRADLSDENTNLSLLKSNSGSDILETVGSLAATEPSIVAALNADFFSVFKGNTGFSLGIEVKDGELLQSPINPSTMATIAYIDKQVSMSYLDFHIMAVAPNWNYQEIRHLNKHTSYFGDVLMYTKDFNGGMSPAPGGEVVEVLVEDGKIKEFRRNMPSVEIPENGCVLVVSEGSNMFFANNFNVGDEIKFDYYITPDVSKADAAFGGGAMLVSEGKAVSTYSHVVSGQNPRSAIGIDKSGQTLFLVAVDGRQSMSKGMYMSELAELMVSLGCEYAVNLDGGGSTNMVASTVLDESLHTVNSPTENRKVINGVGLTYDKKGTEVAGILLKPEFDTVFVGERVKITAAAYDEFSRPISGNIVLSSDSGSFDGDVFVPFKGGEATVVASCGKAIAACEIFVVDEVSGIELNSHISLEKGGEKYLDIAVFDHVGHYVKENNTESFDITSSDLSVASVSGQTVRANKSGTAVISVKRDGAVSYASVTVGGTPERYTDGFDDLSGKFKAYPSDVPGSFELSAEQVLSGKYSGKLSFDFTAETDVNKGAYFSLSDKLRLADSCRELTLNCFSPSDFKHELRAQLVDGNGNLFITSFGRDIKTGQWQKMTAAIPDTAVRPLKLDSVYVLYLSGEERDSGCVYLEDLSLEVSKAAKFVSAEQDVFDIDDGRVRGELVVAALSGDTGTLLGKMINKKAQDAVSWASAGFLLGSGKGFETKEDKNALYIRLNGAKGGLRATDANQWNQLANALWASNKENVFLLVEGSIFGSSDFENRVIRDYLSALDRNVYVISQGTRNTYRKIGDVHYFTLGSGNELLSLTRLENYRYLAFDFGETVTFGWKSLY